MSFSDYVVHVDESGDHSLAFSDVSHAYRHAFLFKRHAALTSVAEPSKRTMK